MSHAGAAGNRKKKNEKNWTEIENARFDWLIDSIPRYGALLFKKEITKLNISHSTARQAIFNSLHEIVNFKGNELNEWESG